MYLNIMGRLIEQPLKIQGLILLLSVLRIEDMEQGSWRMMPMPRQI